MVHHTVAPSTPVAIPSPTTFSTRQQSTGGSPRRFTIYFQDDAVRQRSEQAVQQLLASASSSDATSNSVLLAKKALKYRKVLDRMTGVDVSSPEFDASKFLGVDWCKTKNLKAHCARSN